MHKFHIASLSFWFRMFGPKRHAMFVSGAGASCRNLGKGAGRDQWWCWVGSFKLKLLLRLGRLGQSNHISSFLNWMVLHYMLLIYYMSLLYIIGTISMIVFLAVMTALPCGFLPEDLQSGWQEMARRLQDAEDRHQRFQMEKEALPPLWPSRVQMFNAHILPPGGALNILGFICLDEIQGISICDDSGWHTVFLYYDHVMMKPIKREGNIAYSMLFPNLHLWHIVIGRVACRCDSDATPFHNARDHKTRAQVHTLIYNHKVKWIVQDSKESYGESNLAYSTTT